MRPAFSKRQRKLRETSLPVIYTSPDKLIPPNLYEYLPLKCYKLLPEDPDGHSLTNHERSDLPALGLQCICFAIPLGALL